MLIKNKKGQIGESIQDIFGAIIIIVLLLIFFSFSKAFLGGSTVELKKISTDLAKYNQEHISLNSWLQTSITITYDNKEQNITIAELIKLSKINSSYKTILDQEIQKTFGNDYKIEISNLEKKDTKETTFYIPSNETIFTTIKK